MMWAAAWTMRGRPSRHQARRRSSSPIRPDSTAMAPPTTTPLAASTAPASKNSSSRECGRHPAVRADIDDMRRRTPSVPRKQMLVTVKWFRLCFRWICRDVLLCDVVGLLFDDSGGVAAHRPVRGKAVADRDRHPDVGLVMHQSNKSDSDSPIPVSTGSRADNKAADNSMQSLSTLAHVRAAIDVQHLAGRGVRLVAGQEYRGVRDLVRREQAAAQRDRGPRHLDQLAIAV